MPTTTAFILAGKAHPNDGAINPYHCIQLSEGNAPHFTMRAWVEDDLIYDDLAGDPTRVLVPTLSDPLDDLMLMLTVFAIKDMNSDIFPENGVIYMDSFSPEKRHKLYEEVKVLASKTALKLVVSIIDKQTLLSEEKLLRLKEYGVEYQILK